MSVLLGLGAFAFEVSATSYQAVKIESEWRWSESERVGGHARLQYTGPGARTLTLDGVIFAGTQKGDVTAPARLRALAGKGEPLPLVDGPASAEE